MKTPTHSLRKRISVLMMALLTVQPALAQTYQYRMYTGTGPTNASTSTPAKPKPGTGAGSVDAGDNPELAAPPRLSVRPSSLQFESLPGTNPVTRTALVTNTGGSATMVAGIGSNENFAVTHDCPASLPVDASCQIFATPTSAAPGAVQYEMPVTAPGATTQSVLSLSTYERATDAPAPRLSLSDDMVQMGPLAPGERTSMSVQLTNNGTATALLGGISSGAGFTVTDDCPDSLDAGAACTISASFASFDAKTHSHLLSLTTGAAGPATSLTFYAEVKGDPAILPALELDKSSLTFGPLDAGSAETKKVVLSNRGTAPAMLSGIEAAAPFSLSSSCPDSLAVGASCDLTVTFNAFTQGSAPAQQLIIAAQDGVKTRLLLQGQVKAADSTAPKLTFTPESLDFGDVAVGNSPSLEAVVKNEGLSTAALTGVKVDFGGSSFSQVDNCPSSLAVGASCRVTVTFKATTAESRSGRVAVTASNAPTGILPLSGRGQQALLSVGPLDVDFGTMTLPGTTDTRSVSLSNSGNIPLTGLAISNSNARLSIGYGTCTQTLEAKKGCTLTLTYAPGATGAFAGDFTVNSTNGGSAKVNWKGSALKLATAPSSLTFAETVLGESAADKSITLTNEGAQTIQLGGIGVISGGSHFAQSNNCGVALAAGASCSVQVRYTPATPKSHNGEIGVTVQGSLVGRVALAGSSIEPKLLLSKSSLQFAPTNVGQSSEVLSFNLSNPTTRPATISGMGISAGATEFAQSNNCGAGLTAGSSCTVNVQLTPTSKNGSSGVWSVASSFGTQDVTLSGQGTAPAGSIEGETASVGSPTQPGGTAGDAPVSDGFTHYSIGFLDTEVWTSSAVRNVKFTNKGDGPLTVLGVSVAKGETDFAQSNNCGGTLAPGAFCTLAMQFTPSALGTRTGGIALLSDGGKFYFDLAGKGIGAVGTWRADSSADFGFVGVGTTASRSFTLSNTGTIAAKRVMTELIGEDLRLVSNTCGTSSTAVPLPVGGSCRVTVEYAPSKVGALENAALLTTGTLANGPVRLALTGSAPAPAWSFDATPTGDFGTITVGTANSRTYYLRNMGKVTDTLASLTLEGSSYAITGGTCKADLALTPSNICSVTVTASPAAPGAKTGTLRAVSTQGATVALALSAQAIQSEYAISGSATAMAAAASSYGIVTANSGTLNRTYFLRDNTKIATLSAQNVTLASDGSFKILRVSRVEPNGGYASTCAATATSLTAPCAMPAAGYSIGVEVQFAPTSVGNKTAVLRYEHNGAGGVSEIALEGTGQFNPAASWSTAQNSMVAPTSATLAFGKRTTGSTMDKVIYLRNSGTHGAQAVGVTLSGDTSQFKLVSVVKTRQNTTNDVYACTTGGVISNGTSATPCLAEDPATWVYAYSGVQVIVRYTPTTEGDHSITVSTNSNNGTVVPAAVTMTGTGAFNPTAAWSSAPTSLVAPTAAALSYGTRTTGSILDKVLYVRNTGTNGAQSVGFTLSGDTSQFKIITVYRTYHPFEGYYSACTNASGKIATGGASVTPCLAEDVATPGYPYAGLYMVVRYSPTTVGNHSVKITPTTDNGTVLPEPITVTGSGQFNPTAAWSSANNNVTAPSAAALSYGVRTKGSFIDKALYVHNVGTNGAQAVGFTLSGDTSQFKIVTVNRTYQRYEGYYSACANASGKIATGGASATPCLTEDVAAPGNPYAGVYVVVRYTPTEVGSHSVTVTPTTDNGTVLPAPVTLSGSSEFNATSTWSSTATTLTAPNASYLAFGARATGTATDKVLYIRNSGTYGSQAVGVTLTGDTSQFKVVQIQKTYQQYQGYNNTCSSSSGQIAAGGASTTPCVADDMATAGNQYSGIYVLLRYTPTAAGSYSVTVTPTTNNGTALPAALTFSGTTP